MDPVRVVGRGLFELDALLPAGQLRFLVVPPREATVTVGEGSCLCLRPLVAVDNVDDDGLGAQDLADLAVHLFDLGSLGSCEVVGDVRGGLVPHPRRRLERPLAKLESYGVQVADNDILVCSDGPLVSRGWL